MIGPTSVECEHPWLLALMIFTGSLIIGIAALAIAESGILG